ncbi:MAG: gliding motility-associated-like protein [Polaribacter sp.]|jgi:gliding motility-associated-like protein
MRQILLLLLLQIFVLQCAFAQPANDDCPQAIDLGEAPSCPTDIYNNINATPSTIATNPADNIPSCWFTNENNDVWFSFMTPANGSILDFSITVGGAPGGPNNLPLVQPQIALYRGDCAIDELSELACGDFVSGQSIVNLDILGLDPATTYYLRVNDFSATAAPNWGDFMVCVDSISNAVNVLATVTTDSICNGNVTQLNATGVDDVDFFIWEPATSLSDPNSPTPIASPNTTTTYTITATNLGDNLVTNGDFEMGDTGFTTDYVNGYDSLPQQTWGPLGYEGTYVVLNDPVESHSNFAPCVDHTSGTGNMMISNGSGVAGESIWCQFVSIEPNTDYLFSTWVATMVSENPANLQFSVNGFLIGTPFTAPFLTCDWQQFSSTWNSGVSVIAELCISNQNTVLSGNDFAIDDIYFSIFSAGESSVIVNVSDPEITVLNQMDATCSGVCDGMIEIMASDGFTNSGYSYLWSDGQTTALVENLCSGSYSVTITDDLGCTQMETILINESVFSFAVNELAAPACELQQDADVSLIFGNGTAPFTINWSSGGTGITEEGLTGGQYSVTVEDANGCTNIQAFSIELYPGIIPTEISTTADTICQGELITLTANGGNTAIFEWNNGAISDLINDFPNEQTTYTVTTNTIGQNLIVNGDFELGNVGFTSDHNFHQLPSNGMCQTCYGVAPSPPSLWTQCSDHTSGAGNQMVFNASTDPGLSSWCQTVSLTLNTEYSFTFWAQTINSGSPANLSVSFNNTPIPSAMPLGNASCNWQQFTNTWDSGTQTSAIICINNLEINGGGNDWALDDISFQATCSSVAEKTIYVSQQETSIIAQTNIDCTNMSGVASLSVTGGFFPYNFLWDDGNSGSINNELTAGIHTVTVSDMGNYCEEVLSLEILAVSIPEILDLEVTIGGCDPATNGVDVLPNAIQVFMTGGTPPYTFSIDGGITTQTDSLFENLIDISGLTIIATDVNGCEAIALTPQTENSLVVSIISSEEYLCSPEIELSLSPAVMMDDSIYWSTGEDTDIISISEAGIYEVSIWNAQNCLTTDSITIEECGIYAMPNAFTPDGDGVNDHFGIVAEGDVQVLEFVIYNRWGKEVYNGTGSWDGVHAGAPHPMDVLIYRMVVEAQGIQEILKGEVTLIR